ncbi:unnamed protein product [Bathycoccus prasinos]
MVGFISGFHHIIGASWEDPCAENTEQCGKRYAFNFQPPPVADRVELNLEDCHIKTWTASAKPGSTFFPPNDLAQVLVTSASILNKMAMLVSMTASEQYNVKI